jgi:hypothetical protein
MDSLRLTLERPYKNSNGKALPALLDVTPDGHQVYAESVTTSLLLHLNFASYSNQAGKRGRKTLSETPQLLRRQPFFLSIGLVAAITSSTGICCYP